MTDGDVPAVAMSKRPAELMNDLDIAEFIATGILDELERIVTNREQTAKHRLMLVASLITEVRSSILIINDLIRIEE